MNEPNIREEHPFLQAIFSVKNEDQATTLSRFFKTGPGQYGEGDLFLGIKVPVLRRIVKKYAPQLTLDELEQFVQSPYHEVRMAALLSLVYRFKHAKQDFDNLKLCVDFYLEHTACINNWDLVDLTCYDILGTWLLDKERSLLYDLARNGRTLWEKRIAMVSTMQFIRHGELQDTLDIAAILLEHPHDLIHKAVGWLLREVGKRNKPLLEAFLRQSYSRMSRTTLRYAIERFSEDERKRWLAGKIHV